MKVNKSVCKIAGQVYKVKSLEKNCSLPPVNFSRNYLHNTSTASNIKEMMELGGTMNCKRNKIKPVKIPFIVKTKLPLKNFTYSNATFIKPKQDFVSHFLNLHKISFLYIVSNTVPLINKAQELIKAGNIEAVQNMLEGCNSYPALFNLAVIKCYFEKYKEALELFNDLLKVYNNDAHISFNALICMLKLYRYKQVIQIQNELKHFKWAIHNDLRNKVIEMVLFAKSRLNRSKDSLLKLIKVPIIRKSRASNLVHVGAFNKVFIKTRRKEILSRSLDYKKKTFKTQAKRRYSLSNQKINTIQTNNIYKKYLELVKVYETMISPGYKHYKTHTIVTSCNKDKKIEKNLDKMATTFKSLCENFISKEYTKQSIDFDKEIKEFAMLLFEVQQRNLMLAPFDDSKFSFDLAENNPMMNALSLITNYRIDKKAAPVWNKYKIDLEQLIRMKAIKEGKSLGELPSEFLKRENAKLLIFLGAVNLIKKRLVKPHKKSVIYSEGIISIVRNELLKKVRWNKIVEFRN